MIAPDSVQAPAFTYVAVPIQHVPAVYTLLAELSAAEATAAERTALGGLRWNDDDLHRLARGEVKTTQIVSEIMDILADNPDVPYAPTELADLTHRTPSQLSTLGTHISRHLAAHYKTTNWPFEAIEGKDMTPRRSGAIYYLLTGAQAEQWKRVRTS